MARGILRPGRSAGLLAVGAALLLGAACTTPDYYYTVNGEPMIFPIDPSTLRERHAIGVETQVATLGLPGTIDQDMAATETTQLNGFIGAYLSGGSGQLEIFVPGAGGGQAEALDKGKWIVDHAMARGVRRDEVALMVDTEASGQVLISYVTHVVTVPECGNWYYESSHDELNRSHPNYGCALQRNLGLMIANPADLLEPRVAQSRDTTRDNLVIQQYRAGEVTISERAAVEEAELADIAKE
jgi:pilus assembly protein CpaD